jgi:hypothetical protein
MRRFLFLAVMLVTFCASAGAQSSVVPTNVQAVKVRGVKSASSSACQQHSAFFYFDDTLHKLRVCENGGAFANFVGGGGGGGITNTAPANALMKSDGTNAVDSTGTVIISALTTNGFVKVSGGTGTLGSGSIANGDLPGSGAVTINGTANQINGGGSVALGAALTLSTPQNLHTGAAFQVASIGLGVAAPASGVASVEAAAPSGSANNDLLYPDSIAHRWKMNNNNAGAVQVVASGVDINTSDQVTATHLASALPTNQGGSGTAGALTGIVRGGNPFTAAELSGDASTSGSNAVTVNKVNGISYPATGAAHSVPVVTTANSAATYKAIPDCQDSAGSHLNYTQSTDLFSCGTSSSGGGGSAAGTTNDVQVNSANAFAADTGLFTWDLTAHKLLTATSDSATNTVVSTVESYHKTSGTAAAGFGSGHLFTADTNGSTRRSIGLVYASLSTATDASRQSVMGFQGINNAGALADFFKVSFLPNSGSPVAQVSIAGTASQGNIPQLGSIAGIAAGTGIRFTGTDIWITLQNSDMVQIAGNGINADNIVFDHNAGDVGIGKRVGAGVVRVTNGSTGVGALIGGDRIIAETGNYSPGNADSGTTYTNTGASGEVDGTLPTAAVGLVYTFYVDAAQTHKIVAGASTTITVAGTTSASAGNITSNTPGTSVKLKAISTTHWVAMEVVGSWTVN